VGDAELSRRPREPLTAFDWIGVLASSMTVLVLLALPLWARAWERTFREFGSELPLLTRLVLSWWFPPLLGLCAVLAIGQGLRPRQRIGLRRMWIAGAFAIGAFAIGVCLVGLYLPIFEIAGKIKSE
jgi:hypothetical protein